MKSGFFNIYKQGKSACQILFFNWQLYEIENVGMAGFHKS